jgi:hypothetical protein
LLLQVFVWQSQGQVALFSRVLQTKSMLQMSQSFGQICRLSPRSQTPFQLQPATQSARQLS